MTVVLFAANSGQPDAQSAQARTFADTAAFLGLVRNGERMVSHALQFRIEAVSDTFLYTPPQPAWLTNRIRHEPDSAVNHVSH